MFKSKPSKGKNSKTGSKSKNVTRTKDTVEEKTAFSKNGSNKVIVPAKGKSLNRKDSKTHNKAKSKSSIIKNVREINSKHAEERTSANKSGSRRVRKGSQKDTIQSPMDDKKEKWGGELVAINWLRNLKMTNFKVEFDEIRGIPVYEEKCKVWAANMAKNRHQDYKCYDENRMVVPMKTSDYINASKVNVRGFPRTTLLAQLPKLEVIDEVEQFWKMIFAEQCPSLHITAQPGELGPQGLVNLFPQEAEKFFYINGFFVNTKKAEKGEKPKWDFFVVELLPEGCSNSLVCQIYVHHSWKLHSGFESFDYPLQAAKFVTKGDADLLNTQPVAIASVRGAGRNSALLALSVIVSSFSRGVEPKIKEIVTEIRAQRPMAVDSFSQYASLYMATCHLIKTRMALPDDLQKLITECTDKLKQSSMKIL